MIRARSRQVADHYKSASIIMSTSPKTTVPIDDEFLIEFKRQTEAQWQRANINPDIYGFQFQRGTVGIAV